MSKVIFLIKNMIYFAKKILPKHTLSFKFKVLQIKKKNLNKFCFFSFNTKIMRNIILAIPEIEYLQLFFLPTNIIFEIQTCILIFTRD